MGEHHTFPAAELLLEALKERVGVAYLVLAEIHGEHARVSEPAGPHTVLLVAAWQI
jgi:hypothetical protein